MLAPVVMPVSRVVTVVELAKAWAGPVQAALTGDTYACGTAREGHIVVAVSDASRGVRTIRRDELLEMIGGGDAFRLVMALNEWAFRAKHIPGSEHFNTADELFSSLSPEDDIVVYCTSVDCHASIALYHALVDRGYRHVRRYSGGLTDWEAAGLPLEGEWVT